MPERSRKTRQVDEEKPLYAIQPSQGHSRGGRLQTKDDLMNGDIDCGIQHGAN